MLLINNIKVRRYGRSRSLSCCLYSVPDVFYVTPQTGVSHLEESVAVAGEQGVGARFILTVQSIHSKLVLLSIANTHMLFILNSLPYTNTPTPHIPVMPLGFRIFQKKKKRAHDGGCLVKTHVSQEAGAD